MIFTGKRGSDIDILLVEDDKIIASGLAYALSRDGDNVLHCETAADAISAINARAFSFAILDLTLPDGTGYEVCAHLRKKDETPVIFLTAADDEGNAVRALDMGADDYVVKPFRIRELQARIKTILRRTSGHGDSTIIRLPGGIVINTRQGKVFKPSGELFLTALEYRLLLTFAMNAGQILTRNQLLESIWDAAGNFVNDNTLTVYIKRLREKLEDDPQNPQIIQTVRGLGYLVTAEAHGDGSPPC